MRVSICPSLSSCFRVLVWFLLNDGCETESLFNLFIMFQVFIIDSSGRAEVVFIGHLSVNSLKY